MRHLQQSGAAILVAFALAGCSTMRGGQESVLTTSIDQVKKDDYTRDEIISAYESATDKRAYRAKIAGLFMDAIDETYEEYTKNIFNEGLQVGLGFEGAIIGLSAAGALFEDAADDLATVIAGFAGTRATIDKNLYFDRTLPALIATMDARRAKVESAIITGLTKTPEEYPIQALFRDLRRYNNAGSLYRAVTEVTSEAAEEKALAEAEVSAKLAYGCDASEDLIRAVDPIARFVLTQRQILTSAVPTVAEKQEADRKLRIVALAIDVDPTLGPPLDLATAISRSLNQKYCSVDQVSAARSKLDRLLPGGIG